MIDRLARGVFLEMTLGDVSLHGIVVYEHVIPGLILRWTGPRDLLVPFVATLEYGIDVDDDSAIIEAIMVNDLPRREFCFERGHDTPRFRLALYNTRNRGHLAR